MYHRDNTGGEGATANGEATATPPRVSVGVWLMAAALLFARRCAAHIATYGGFARDWLHSRHINALLWGAPALFAAVACYELIWSGYRDREAAAPLILEYKIAAQEALDAGRLREAEVLLRKVATLDASNIDGVFGLGLVASRQGDRDTARRLMQRIAPLDRDGDPRARHWLAMDMMPQLQQLSDDDRHALEEHLLRLRKEPPFDRDASVLLGQLYMSQQRLDDAAKHIEAACRWHPELFLLLAQLRAATGGPAPADGDLARARDVFRRQTQDDPGNVEACLKWAETEKLLRAYANAEQILVAGLQRKPSATFREALIAFYMTRFDATRNSHEALNVEALEFLDRALLYGPHNAKALSQLAELTADRGGNSDVVRSASLQAIAVGKASATAHLLLGLFAASSGDSRTAAFHLEHARQLNPQTPLIINNLAWGLATMTPPQFQRALNVTNAALTAEPANRVARQTRGQILLRIGRYMEAVQDLDLDMPSDPRHKEVRVAVSEVRERLSAGVRTASPRETSPAATQAHPAH
jgi:tetratricopeptide (TPR) repeat protein